MSIAVVRDPRFEFPKVRMSDNIYLQIGFIQYIRCRYDLYSFRI